MACKPFSLQQGTILSRNLALRSDGQVAGFRFAAFGSVFRVPRVWHLSFEGPRGKVRFVLRWSGL